MKAALVVAAVALAACSAQSIEHDAPLSRDVAFEPYPGVQWYDPDGEPVPDESDTINAISGPEHCEWDSGVILHLRLSPRDETRQYFRDPRGVFPQDALLETFDDDVALPETADDTGYRTDFMELWLDAQKDSVAYLVFAERTEQWPRGEDIACG